MGWRCPSSRVGSGGLQFGKQHSRYQHDGLFLEDNRSTREHDHGCRPDHCGCPNHAAVPSTVATTSVSTCPTLAQANTALGGSYSGPITTRTAGGGIVCEYTSSTGNAGVTIFAHQSTSVFAGQVAHAPGAPAMPSISGVGDGAYGMTTGGRSVVNAYSNGSRTLVAAQASGALPPVEALARVALADN